MDVFYMPWIAELIQSGKTSETTQYVVVSNELEEIKPRYRLIFFDGKGITEISRMILAYSGIPFIDTRLSYKQWHSKIDGKCFNFKNLHQNYCERRFEIYIAIITLVFRYGIQTYSNPPIRR